MDMRKLIQLVEDSIDGVDESTYTFKTKVEYDEVMQQMYYDDFISNASGECEVERIGDIFLIGSGEKPYFDNVEDMSIATMLSLVDDYYLDRYVDVDLDDLNFVEEDEELGETYNIDDYILEVKNKYKAASELRASLSKFTKENIVKIQNQEGGKIEEDYTVNDYGYIFKIVLLDKVPDYVTKDYIENILTRTPIYAKTTIYDEDGDEFDEIYLTDYMSDEYDWDKDEVINSVEEHYTGQLKDELLAHLREELPDEPN
jgi:hypothetical protein